MFRLLFTKNKIVGIEIERRFLLKDESWKKHVNYSILITQGYISTDPNRTVRVRIDNVNGIEQGYIVVKGQKINGSGSEFDYPIPVVDAWYMLENMCTVFITKVRHIVKVGGMEWEIDEFFGDNLGLKLAEIELDDIAQEVKIPTWVGEEITQDHRYSNVSLSVKPYNTWT